MKNNDKTSKSRQRNIPTSIPDVEVHVTYSYRDGRIILRGYPIDINTGARIDGAKTLRRTANYPEDLHAAEKYLVSAVTQKLPRKKSSGTTASKLPLSADNLIVKAFNFIVENDDPITSAWCAVTMRKYMAYFKYNVLPVIASKGDEWSDDDLDDLRHSLIDKALLAKKSSGNLRYAERTVNGSLAACAVIYHRMREFDPQLPDIKLRPLIPEAKHVQREQQKSLLTETRDGLAVEVAKDIESYPGLAMAASLMLTTGLRTAEACAVHKEDLVYFRDSDLTSIAIKWQERDGHRDARLKTDNAYRLVPLTSWAKEVVMRCLDLIGELEDDKPLCSSSDLSSYIRSLLPKCGCTKDFLLAAEKDQAENPDRDAIGKPINDLGAYVLRRDWASRARNICGLTAPEIDYLLGHVIDIPKKLHADYKLEEYQREISVKLERFVFDSALSRHPGITPIKLEHGSNINVEAFSSFCVANSSAEPLKVTVDIKACEAEDFCVISPPSSLVNETKRLIETNCMRADRPVIGPALDRKENV